MAGIGTRLLKITVDGDDYTAECAKAVITAGPSESDFVTFAEAASGGGRDYKLNLRAVQDAAAATLWSLVFSNAGDTVPCVLMPYGNETPTATEPHFEFDAVVSEPDGDFIGGEANSSTSARMTFEAAWSLEAKPVKVTA